MNKRDSKKIAETITNDQLMEMFNNAKSKITNWEKVSNVNKGMTIGTSWNILAKDFDLEHKYHILAKVNMIREFGEYLPESLKPKKTPKKKNTTKIIHQDPKF